MAVAVQDRTQEFKSCVTSLAKSSQTTVAARQQHLNHSAAPRSRSEFAMRASTIAKEIGDTTEMLQRLAALAKRKTLFDDRPVEFNELTFVIKQKLSKINDTIAHLKDFQKSQRMKGGAWGNKGDSQLDEHSGNVVVMLQDRLTDATTGFTKVLEERTQNIQQSKSRTEQFMSSTSQAVQQSSSPLYSTSTNNNNNNNNNQYARTASGASSASLENGNSANPYSNAALQDGNPYGSQEYLTLPSEQQMLLLEEQQDQYLNQRSNAVEAIESTIQELGGIFSQLASMVAEQRETVQRIDANTEDISLNVSGAQRELLKYYARISSNRWLMMKMFGIILVFFFIWVLVS